jgi:hypothetical protein
MLKTDLHREPPACWDQLGKTYPLGHSSLCNKKQVTAKNQNRNSKQILRGNSPNFLNPHSCVCERLYIPTIQLPIRLQEICGPILGIYEFPEKEYIIGIFVAVQLLKDKNKINSFQSLH